MTDKVKPGATETEVGPRDRTTTLVDFWYLVVPSRLRRWSPRLAAVIEDGAWIARLPTLAAYAPIATAVIGVASAIAINVLGRPDDIHVWSESLLLMIVAIASGTLAGTLGVAFVAGYVVADLVGTVVAIGTGLVESAIGGIAAAFVEYALLALVAIVAPQMSKRAARELPIASTALGVPLRAVSYAGLAAILIAFWAQATVVLIRPTFTWVGYRSPEYDAIVVVQTQWPWLASTALIAGLARAVGEFVFYRRAVGLGYGRSTRDVGLLARLPAVVNAVISAGTVTILWAGMYESILDGIVVGVIVLAVSTLGPELITSRLPWWSAFVTRVPLLLRLLIAIGGGIVIATLFANLLWGVGNFRPVLIAAVAVFVLFALILPETHAAKTASLRAGSARR